MAKKGSRLREFEKNNRVLDISSNQEARRKKKSEKMKLAETAAGDPAGQAGSGGLNAGGSGSGGKSGGKRHRINWIKMGSVIISLVFLAVVAFSVKNIYDLKDREAALMERNQQLLRIREELTMELANVHTDEYIEELARRELKLVKGNELIFYFPDDFKLQRKESGQGSSGEEGSADTDTGDKNE